MRYLFTSCIFMVFVKLSGQSVNSVSASVEGTSLVIQYEMIDLIDGQRFRVRLYSSQDEFSEPILSGLSGAIGEDVPLGESNRIVIASPQKVLGATSGPITFQVATELIYSPVEMKRPGPTARVARGGKLRVSWQGGLDSDHISFDLYRHDVLLVENAFSSMQNPKGAWVPIPKGAELGEGYRMDMKVKSLEAPIPISNIKVKRRFSVAERILVGLVVVSAADYFLNPNSIIYYQILGKKDPLPEPPALPNSQ